MQEHLPTLRFDQAALSQAAVLAHLRWIAGAKLELTPAQLESFTPGLRVVEDLQLDSLAQVTLLSAIEDDFGMTIEFEDRERIQTVADLVEIIRGRATRSVPCG